MPRGRSLGARLFNVEIKKGDISPAKLTEAQHDAEAGLYAASLAGFLRWLASRYADVLAGLRQEHAALRGRALADADGQHARTPGIVADLALGMRYFLDFAAEAGAITAAERETLAKRCWAALGRWPPRGAEHNQAAEPSGQFLPPPQCRHRLRARPPRGAGRGGPRQSRAMGMALRAFGRRGTRPRGVAAARAPRRLGGRRGRVS